MIRVSHWIDALGWYWDILGRSWHQLYAYPLRSILTSLGVVISVTGVIAVAGVMAALEAGVNRELAALGSDTVNLTPNFRKLMSGNKVEGLGRREWKVLQTLSGIGSPVASVDVRPLVVKFRSGMAITPRIVGVTDQLANLYRMVPEIGRFIMPSDEAGHLRVCVIGRQIIDRLGLASDPLGQRILVSNMELVVIGMLPPGASGIGGRQPFGDIYVPLSVAEELNGSSGNLALSFRLLASHKREMVLRELTQRLRQSIGTAPEEEDDFQIEDAIQIRRTNEAIIGMIAMVLIILVGITLLVGGIGIMNVMLVSVNERTQEIGLQRALGATRQHIRVQFLTEAGLLAAIGASVGVVLGWLLASLSVLFIPQASNVVLPLWSMVTSVGTAVLVGVIAGSIPAFRAANLDPVVALAVP